MLYRNGDKRIGDTNVVYVDRIDRVLPVIEIEGELIPAPSENAGEYTAIEFMTINDSGEPINAVLLLPRGRDIDTYLLADAIRED